VAAPPYDGGRDRQNFLETIFVCGGNPNSFGFPPCPPLSKLEQAKIILIGAGGIGSEIAEGLFRKGIGELRIYDHDTIEMSNFQDAVALEHNLNADIVVCGVDNNAARVAVSKYYRKLEVPVLFIAVDYMAENGYVFVQEPGGPCFGCAFPNCFEKKKAPCLTPAVKDILKVVAGIDLYSIDSLLMNRKRNWNYRNVHLAGFSPSCELIIEQKKTALFVGKIVFDKKYAQHRNKGKMRAEIKNQLDDYISFIENSGKISPLEAKKLKNALEYPEIEKKTVPELLTRREVADLLRVSSKTVNRLSDTRTLKRHKAGKRAYRYLESEVYAYLELT